jgi:hypothetical protein
MIRRGLLKKMVDSCRPPSILRRRNSKHPRDPERHGHSLCILYTFKAHTQPATQIPTLPVPPNPLETLNCDTGSLEDDYIRDPLNQLKGAMVQYLSMARRKL